MEKKYDTVRGSAIAVILGFINITPELCFTDRT